MSKADDPISQEIWTVALQLQAYTESKFTGALTINFNQGTVIDVQEYRRMRIKQISQFPPSETKI